MVEMYGVSSSNIDSIGYDEQKSQLYIQFNRGRMYVYDGVPQHIYTNLMNASSHGKYHAQFIKNSYPYRRI